MSLSNYYFNHLYFWIYSVDYELSSSTYVLCEKSTFLIAYFMCFASIMFLQSYLTLGVF